MNPVDIAAVTAAAKRAGLTNAQWLTEAIREKIAREREPVPGEIEPPPTNAPAGAQQLVPTAPAERPDTDPLLAIAQVIRVLSAPEISRSRARLLLQARAIASRRLAALEAPALAAS